jgi:HEAT repeat protein
MESGPQICAQKKKPEFFLVVLVVGLSFLERFNRAGFFGTDVKKLKDSGDVPGLISALIQNDPQVQYDAAEALGELGDKRAVGPLITELKNNELSGVRWKAAEALSRIGAASVDELIGVLQHEDDDVRWKAAIALGEIGDPKAIGPLIKTSL